MEHETAYDSCPKSPASRAKRLRWLKMLLMVGVKSPPKEGGCFADYALVSLHCLRIHLGESSRNALDLLSEMPHILAEIGLEQADLPDHSTLVKKFDRFQMKIWRVMLRQELELYELSDCALINATFPIVKRPASTTSDGRIIVFRHSKQPLSSILVLKPSLTYILQPRNVTTRTSAGKGYDWQRLRDKLREEGVRPLIKHREFHPIDHATTSGSMRLSTAGKHCQRPFYQWSSARSVIPCVCGLGIKSSMKLFWCVISITLSVL